MTAEKPVWFAARKCWRKRYAGKVFYFSGSLTQDQAAEQWEQKKSALDGKAEDPLAPAYRHEAAKATKRAKFFRMMGEDETAAKEDAYAARLLKAVKSKDALEALTPEYVPDGMRAIWQDRFATVDKVTTTSTGGMFATVKTFVAQKEAEAKAGTITNGRSNNVKIQLDAAKDILGDLALDAITGLQIEKLYTELINREDLSAAYASGIFATFKQFVLWLGYTDQIPAVPGCLIHKKWRFAKATKVKAAKKKLPYTTKEITAMVAKAKPEMQLWILLGLNCAMTQQDISDLRPDEVDWKNGKLTRVRSKLKTNTTAMEITYVLWPKTFALLKRFGKRKGERVLVSRNGNPLKCDKIVKNEAGESHYTKNDNIGLTFRRFMKKFPEIKKQFKAFRSTGSGVLQGTTYADMRVFYLGDSPRTVLDRSYSPGSPQFQTRFDDAIKTLGKELTLAD